MKELNERELYQVNGTGLIGAFFIGVGLGQLGAKLAKKYL